MTKNQLQGDAQTRVSKGSIFLIYSLFPINPRKICMNLKNSIHKRIVEYQIKQLKNELSKFD
jgi:hypothetical protein